MKAFVSLFICVNIWSVNTLANRYKGLAECNVRRLSEVNKIIGGETTKLIDFPWQTSLQVKHLPSHVCGAALIADQWVLTAAHCFRRSSDPNYWKVKLGKYNLTQFDSNGRDFYISKIFIHENYSSVSQINDITLLKLSNKVDFNGKDRHLKPICLAPKSLNITPGSVCVVTGWGKSKDGEKHSNILLKISQPIVDNISCQKAWPGIQWPISDGHICAGNLQEEKGVCTGDSGGPLLCMANDGQVDKWIQVGVASWTSTPCAVKGYPSIFTRVSYYNDWIQNKILNN